MDNNSSMDLQSIPLKVRLEVAGKFWDYMKETKTKPETMAELRQLYVNVYRPLLDFPLGQRVKFASVLSCMKTSGFLKLSGEIIDYQVEQNPRSEVEEGQDVDTNQELPPQNAEKTSRKVKILKGPNGKEEENLDTKRYSRLELLFLIVPYNAVQRYIMNMFPQYMVIFDHIVTSGF